jgi:hypothetical protein
MTRVAEREVIIHEQITRGAEGMTSAYDSWWLRFMSRQFESEITITRESAGPASGAR